MLCTPRIRTIEGQRGSTDISTIVEEDNRQTARTRATNPGRQRDQIPFDGVSYKVNHLVWIPINTERR